MADSFEEELSEFRRDPMEGYNDEYTGDEDAKGTKRGRPKIQDSWTRVIRFAPLKKPEVLTFPIVTDLLVAEGYPDVAPNKNQPAWEPIFKPKDFLKKNKHMQLDSFRIDAEHLRLYGEEISENRKNIHDNVLSIDQSYGLNINQEIQEVSDLAKKMTHFDYKRRKKAD